MDWCVECTLTDIWLFKPQSAVYCEQWFDARAHLCCGTSSGRQFGAAEFREKRRQLGNMGVADQQLNHGMEYPEL